MSNETAQKVAEAWQAIRRVLAKPQENNPLISECLWCHVADEIEARINHQKLCPIGIISAFLHAAPAATDATTISLDKEQHMHLTILLNIELRNYYLGEEYRECLNGVFKQLAGRDHDVVASLRDSKSVLVAPPPSRCGSEDANG